MALVEEVAKHVGPVLVAFADLRALALSGKDMV